MEQNVPKLEHTCMRVNDLDLYLNLKALTKERLSLISLIQVLNRKNNLKQALIKNSLPYRGSHFCDVKSTTKMVFPKPAKPPLHHLQTSQAGK